MRRPDRNGRAGQAQPRTRLAAPVQATPGPVSVGPGTEQRHLLDHLCGEAGAGPLARQLSRPLLRDRYTRPYAHAIPSNTGGDGRS